MKMTGGSDMAKTIEDYKKDYEAAKAAGGRGGHEGRQ